MSPEKVIAMPALQLTLEIRDVQTESSETATITIRLHPENSQPSIEVVGQ